MKVWQLLATFLFIALVGAVVYFALRPVLPVTSSPLQPITQQPGSSQENTTTNQNTSTGNTGRTPVTGNCVGHERTGKGNTRNYSVTVNNGCVIIVQGVEGHNVGSYNWNNGAVAALGPGSYSFTIVDGAYQITSESLGQQVFCNQIQGIQSRGDGLSTTYPLSGWSAC